MAAATPTIPPTHAGKIPRQVDGRLGNIGRRHSESSAGEVYRLGAGSGTEVERAPASQSEFVQRIFEVFVQFRIEPGHGFDLLSLIQLLPMWELALLIFGHIHPSPIALVSVGGLVDIGVRLRSLTVPSRRLPSGAGFAQKRPDVAHRKEKSHRTVKALFKAVMAIE